MANKNPKSNQQQQTWKATATHFKSQIKVMCLQLRCKKGKPLRNGVTSSILRRVSQLNCLCSVIHTHVEGQKGRVVVSGWGRWDLGRLKEVYYVHQSTVVGWNIFSFFFSSGGLTWCRQSLVYPKMTERAWKVSYIKIMNGWRVGNAHYPDFIIIHRTCELLLCPIKMYKHYTSIKNVWRKYILLQEAGLSRGCHDHHRMKPGP